MRVLADGMPSYTDTAPHPEVSQQQTADAAKVAADQRAVDETSAEIKSLTGGGDEQHPVNGSVLKGLKALEQQLAQQQQQLQADQKKLASDNNLTLASDTDQAWAKYEAAVQKRNYDQQNAPDSAGVRQDLLASDDAAVAQARQDLFAAVRNEIGSQVNPANTNIQSGAQASTADRIIAYGNVILGRHASDPLAQQTLTDAVNDALIPQLQDNLTPKQKLDAIKTALQGASPDAVARIMQNPTVQQVLQDAASWVAEPYNGADPQDRQAALEASQRLADLTDGLPPALAAQLVQQTMPTIQKIAGVDANYGDGETFANLSRVAGSLDDSPQGQALVSQIAKAYGKQFATWENRFENPTTGYITYAVGHGASARLSLELASQLQADGKSKQAAAVIHSVADGVESLQRQIHQDLKDYADHTEKLNWLVAHFKDKLTPTQLQQAVDNYTSQQGADWQDELKDIENRITSDVGMLNSDIGQLQGLSSPELSQVAAGVVNHLKDVVGHDTMTQEAVDFAAKHTPLILEGPDRSKAAAFWIEEVDRSSDLAQSVAKAYVAANVLPALKDFNPNDPASVSKLYKALDDFQSQAPKLLGMSPDEVRADINDLKGIVTTLRTTDSVTTAAQNLKDLDSKIADLKEWKDKPFSTPAASLVFRTLAFGIAGATALSRLGETVDDPSAQNIIASIGQSLGAVQDGVAFASRVQLLSPDDPLAKWGTRASKLGEITEKFVGFLDASFFAAGLVQDISSDNIPAAAVDIVGTAGALVGTFLEDSWAGPLGWGATILATAVLDPLHEKKDIQDNTEEAEKFLRGAHLEETVAQTLARDAGQEASNIQNQLDLSPEQLQELAAKHPEVFSRGPRIAQAAINVAKAAGMFGADVSPFFDAAAKDQPASKQAYLQTFYMLDPYNDTKPVLKPADLYNDMASQLPTAAAYAQQHVPNLVGPNADTRRQADQVFEEAPNRSPDTIANLLDHNHNAVYQAEIIRIMKSDGTLDDWITKIVNNDTPNGGSDIARTAIQAAQSEGVLTGPEAQTYLTKLKAHS